MCLAIQALVDERHFQHLVVRLRGLQFQLRFEQGLAQLRIAELKNNGVRLNFRTRFDQHPLHQRGTGRSNPALVFGHQRARAAHFAQELPALYRAKPQALALHRRRRRLEPCQHHAHCAQQDSSNAHEYNLSASPLGLDIFSDYVHAID